MSQKMSDSVVDPKADPKNLFRTWMWPSQKLRDRPPNWLSPYIFTYLIPAFLQTHRRKGRGIFRLATFANEAEVGNLFFNSVGQSTIQLPSHQNSLMAPRAIPVSACRLVPPSSNGTRKWNGLYAPLFIQSTFVDSRKQCKMRSKPENSKDPLTMIYVT